MRVLECLCIFILLLKRRLYMDSDSSSPPSHDAKKTELIPSTMLKFHGKYAAAAAGEPLCSVRIGKSDALGFTLGGGHR